MVHITKVNAMKRKCLSIFTAAMLAISSATQPASIVRTVTFLIAGATAFSTAFDGQAGAGAQTQALTCVKAISRSRVLGIGCFAALYGYRGAAEVLKALWAHQLANELVEAGIRVGDLLRKPPAGAGIEQHRHHVSVVER